MTKHAEVILERLEATTARLAVRVQTSTVPSTQLQEVDPLLAERGELIQQLTRALDEDKAVSYVQFNRLVVVQVQGGQIASSLTTLRTTLCNLTLQAQRQRSYADCLQGMIDIRATHCSESA